MFKILFLAFICFFLTACENATSPGQPGTTPTVPTTPTPENPTTPVVTGWPAWQAAYGRQAIYNRAQSFYMANKDKFANTSHAIFIDFSLKNTTPRFFLVNLKTGKVEKYYTSHGSGSDPGNTGYATKFSNISGSNMSSLGVYRTSVTYNGKNGYSLRLQGLESTNSKAEARAIVMHPATYVSESGKRAGRSNGCPALDPSVSKSVIDRVKGGALLIISN